jgi:hypothetical protein
VSFAPCRLHHPSDVGHLIQSVVTYLWLPTEYVRKHIGASGTLTATVLVPTVGIVVLGVARIRRMRAGGELVIVCVLVSVLVWLVVYLSAQAVAPRVAHLALPLWVALALSGLPARFALAGALLLGLNACTLYQISEVTAPTFIRLAP